MGAREVGARDTSGRSGHPLSGRSGHPLNQFGMLVPERLSQPFGANRSIVDGEWVPENLDSA